MEKFNDDTKDGRVLATKDTILTLSRYVDVGEELQTKTRGFLQVITVPTEHTRISCRLTELFTDDVNHSLKVVFFIFLFFRLLIYFLYNSSLSMLF